MTQMSTEIIIIDKLHPNFPDLQFLASAIKDEMKTNDNLRSAIHATTNLLIATDGRALHAVKKSLLTPQSYTLLKLTKSAIHLSPHQTPTTTGTLIKHALSWIQKAKFDLAPNEKHLANNPIQLSKLSAKIHTLTGLIPNIKHLLNIPADSYTIGHHTVNSKHQIHLASDTRHIILSAIPADHQKEITE